MSLSSPSRQHADQLERVIVRTSRLLGVGWDQIGQVVGVSGDEAREQYGEEEPELQISRRTGL